MYEAYMDENTIIDFFRYIYIAFSLTMISKRRMRVPTVLKNSIVCWRHFY